MRADGPLERAQFRLREKVWVGGREAKGRDNWPAGVVKPKP